ncbi:hypothetical protein [Pontibacter roseus]|uniref:hypothetical protein n=1 Tax=Pontibacter roseus TaxID=336989 RepID=UPI0012FC1547|nr:hypothetical protein [Pontibacter roseus]
MKTVLFWLMAMGTFIIPLQSELSVPELLPEETVQVQDTTALLATTWILRQKAGFHPGRPDCVLQASGVELTFFADSTFRLVQQNESPNAIVGAEAVEEGEWRLNAAKGLIGVRTTRSNGMAIRSAMLNRWEIAQMKSGKLILKWPGFGKQYLLFEEKKK